MAVHKLSLDDFDEVNYELIAIHTSLEDYHLAYFINRQLPIQLKKNPSEIQVSNKEGETFFSRFSFEDHDAGIYWDLLQNKNEVRVQSNVQNLFGDTATQIAARAYLLPEFKKVDYLLKVSDSSANTSDVVQKLGEIDRISTIYSVDANNIKSKNNLIF